MTRPICPVNRRPIPSGVKNYITPEGHRRMQDELRQLLRVERPKVVERPLGERRLHLR
jgi:hypothetical protein